MSSQGSVDPDAIYDAVDREAKAIHQLIGVGLSALRRANMTNVGTYYAAFSAFTFGIERACKLSLTLDSWICLDRFSTDGELKQYLHKIPDLVESVRAIREKHAISSRFDLPANEETCAVVEFLGTASAADGRYRNLNYLASALRGDYYDLAAEWFALISSYAPPPPSNFTRDAANAHALAFDQLPMVSISLQAADRTSINSMEQLFLYQQKEEVVKIYGTFLSAQVARFCVDTLVTITDIARSQGKHVPWLEEVFNVLRQPDRALKKRKRFDSYY